MKMKAFLILEDGTVLEISIGADIKTIISEIVFKHVNGQLSGSVRQMPLMPDRLYV